MPGVGDGDRIANLQDGRVIARAVGALRQGGDGRA